VPAICLINPERKKRQTTDTTAQNEQQHFPHKNTGAENANAFDTKETAANVIPHASRSKCLILLRTEIALHTQQHQAIQFYSTKLNRFPQRLNAQLCHATTP
jgi:hypothetical protein